jgi:4-diphosphocytidyl-2-C-methyl-D-erythritol kinase
LSLTHKAPAKLNLGLHVLRKRADGYHDLETVFVHIGWTEQVSVSLADEITFECDDPALAGEGNNLCLRAAELLREVSGVDWGAHISLKKRIPAGAGLGGGSSDAASTLMLLNILWELGKTPEELRAVGADLGSDVPAFLHESPAYATGRGEELSVLADSLSRRPLEIPYAFTVLKPDVHVSTTEAYESVVPNDGDRADLVALIRSLNLMRWTEELVNDFEAPISHRHPEIRYALQFLSAQGAGYSAMSGSGSACFGVFESAQDSRRAAEEAREEGYSAWSGWAYQPIRPF